jgi:hypothetical protein
MSKLTTAKIKAMIVALVELDAQEFSEDAKIVKNWKRTEKYYCFNGGVYPGMSTAEYNLRKRVFVREFLCGDLKATVETPYPEDTHIVHFELETV